MEGCINIVKNIEKQGITLTSGILTIIQLLLQGVSDTMHQFDCRDVTSLVSFVEFCISCKSIESISTIEQKGIIDISNAFKMMLKDQYILRCSDALPIDLSRSLRSLVTIGVEMTDDDITAVQQRLNATINEMQR